VIVGRHGLGWNTRIGDPLNIYKCTDEESCKEEKNDARSLRIALACFLYILPPQQLHLLFFLLAQLLISINQGVLFNFKGQRKSTNDTRDSTKAKGIVT